MARTLAPNIKMEITLDAAGAPQSATVTYAVIDGAASKGGVYGVPTPDFTKILHNSGAAGEFWKDTMDAIKTQESI